MVIHSAILLGQHETETTSSDLLSCWPKSFSAWMAISNLAEKDHKSCIHMRVLVSRQPKCTVEEITIHSTIVQTHCNVGCVKIHPYTLTAQPACCSRHCPTKYRSVAQSMRGLMQWFQSCCNQLCN